MRWRNCLSDAAVATAVLGSIQSPDTLKRIEEAPALADVVLASRKIDQCRISRGQRAYTTADEDRRSQRVGVHARAFRSDQLDRQGSGRRRPPLRCPRRSCKEHGALTVGLYSTKQEVIDAMTEATLRAGVACRSTC